MRPHAERPRLVLASASPRRAKLLREAGFEFDAVVPPLDDATLRMGAGAGARAWVSSLAHLKAAATLGMLRSDAPHTLVVLGADTLVVKDGRVMGQPRDADDARSILAALRSGSHRVVTGVTILSPGRPRVIFCDEAVVRVGAVGDAEIESYLASGGWRGKAGAYNLEERIGAGWPIEFDGDPATVMGLPMRLLVPRLRAALREPRAEGAPA